MLAPAAHKTCTGRDRPPAPVPSVSSSPAPHPALGTAARLAAERRREFERPRFGRYGQPPGPDAVLAPSRDVPVRVGPSRLVSAGVTEAGRLHVLPISCS